VHGIVNRLSKCNYFADVLGDKTNNWFFSP
jgi:hypothetical protein